MKHFLVNINYLLPIEQLTEILPHHRAFLQTGYDAGCLLCSGPKNPKTGGLVIARADSLAAIQSFFANDPYRINKVAEYTYTEFEPVKHQPFLANWVAGK